jgi:hypothetical protein
MLAWTENKMMKHKHHIIPKYEEGSDDPSNLVELTLIQHAMWHYAEWLRKGNWQDNLAWRGLASITTKEAIVRESASMGARSPRPNRGPMINGNDKRRKAMLGKTKTKEMKKNSSLAAKRRWERDDSRAHFAKYEEIWKNRLNGRDFSNRQACSIVAKEYNVSYQTVRNWAIRLELKGLSG